MEPQDTVADRLLSELLGRNNSRAEIHVNAGGMGVWVATTACCVMLAVNLVMVVMFLSTEARYTAEMKDQSSKISKMQDYLNAIYAQAPQLKPKEEE